MKETLLTFDVDGKATAFTEAMLKLKYSNFSESGINLPSGTLIHKERTQFQAINEAKKVAKILGINLIRCATFTAESDYLGIGTVKGNI
jgi:hypothetical protein